MLVFKIIMFCSYKDKRNNSLIFVYLRIWVLTLVLGSIIIEQEWWAWSHGIEYTQNSSHFQYTNLPWGDDGWEELGDKHLLYCVVQNIGKSALHDSLRSNSWWTIISIKNSVNGSVDRLLRIWGKPVLCWRSLCFRLCFFQHSWEADIVGQ